MQPARNSISHIRVSISYKINDFVLKSRSKSSSKVDVNLIDPNAAAWAIAHSRRTAAAPLLRFGEIRSSRSSFTVWRALRDALYTTI